MRQTLAAEQSSRLVLGVGFAEGRDTVAAVLEAARGAQAALGGRAAHVALVVTAGIPSRDLVAAVRSVLGPVGIAGGATSALLADAGPIEDGALVVCVANPTAATAVATGRDLPQASQSAARLILAARPLRVRYPRGLTVAFARPAFGAPAQEFLAPWRQLMGPKMRTACAVLPLPLLYGAPSGAPLASVACVEGPYATGLGYADGFADDGSVDPEILIRGAVDATITALKRLEGQGARLVLVIESAARHAALGALARDEWAAMRSEVGDRAPCVGWLCAQVAAYGRGVWPVDAHGSLVILALGDPPRDQLGLT